MLTEKVKDAALFRQIIHPIENGYSFGDCAFYFTN